jgi:hypothetical protein
MDNELRIEPAELAQIEQTLAAARTILAALQFEEWCEAYGRIVLGHPVTNLGAAWTIYTATNPTRTGVPK